MHPDINYGTTDTNHETILRAVTVGVQLVSARLRAIGPGLLQLVHERREEE